MTDMLGSVEFQSEEANDPKLDRDILPDESDPTPVSHPMVENDDQSLSSVDWDLPVKTALQPVPPLPLASPPLMNAGSPSSGDPQELVKNTRSLGQRSASSPNVPVRAADPNTMEYFSKGTPTQRMTNTPQTYTQTVPVGSPYPAGGNYHNTPGGIAPGGMTPFSYPMGPPGPYPYSMGAPSGMAPQFFPSGTPRSMAVHPPQTGYHMYPHSAPLPQMTSDKKPLIPNRRIPLRRKAEVYVTNDPFSMAHDHAGKDTVADGLTFDDIPMPGVLSVSQPWSNHVVALDGGSGSNPYKAPPTSQPSPGTYGQFQGLSPNQPRPPIGEEDERHQNTRFTPPSSPGQQYLEEELYKLRTKPHHSQSSLQTSLEKKDQNEHDSETNEKTGSPAFNPQDLPLQEPALSPVAEQDFQSQQSPKFSVIDIPSIPPEDSQLPPGRPLTPRASTHHIPHLGQQPKAPRISRLGAFLRKPFSTHPSFPQSQNVAISDNSEKRGLITILGFPVYKVPEQVYLIVLLRLPSLYFSRVARIFEDSDMTLPHLKAMAMETASQGMGTHFDARKVLESSAVHPAYERLKSTWESFIDSVMREWKTFNIISVLLLSAILTMLQIEAAADDPLTRYAALLSLICALMSLLFGCMYIIRFGTMRKTYKAAEWALEAKKSKTVIWWNVWVLLAMPAIWLTWSIILYIACIMSYVWRTGGSSKSVIPDLPDTALLAVRTVITIVLGFGLLYGSLVLVTFRRYGTAMDIAWKRRIDGWIEEKYRPLPVDGDFPAELGAPVQQTPVWGYPMPPPSSTV